MEGALNISKFGFSTYFCGSPLKHTSPKELGSNHFQNEMTAILKECLGHETLFNTVGNGSNEIQQCKHALEHVKFESNIILEIRFFCFF